MIVAINCQGILTVLNYVSGAAWEGRRKNETLTKVTAMCGWICCDWICKPLIGLCPYFRLIEFRRDCSVVAHESTAYSWKSFPAIKMWLDSFKRGNKQYWKYLPWLTVFLLRALSSPSWSATKLRGIFWCHPSWPVGKRRT